MTLFFSDVVSITLTAVGLPLITIVAVTCGVAGGSWGHLTKDLPKTAATIMAVLIFIIIGPAFAACTGLVAYEMAVETVLHRCLSSSPNSLFDCIFCGSDVLLMVTQGKNIDVIGRY
ncbi:branched-chain amino acid transport system II carrier protein [Vibrio lentus]|nr:branched-chain amino acid transport system II carrier protein [Vibrio lentus]